MPKINGTVVDEFTYAYIVAAFWSSNDESTPAGGEPLDKNYDPADLDPATLAEMVEDCRKFQAENGNLITDENYIGSRPDGASVEDQAGYHFWLTRCGHGTGFWDGDWKGEVGRKLTNASERFGEYNLTVGDDGKVYGN